MRIVLDACVLFPTVLREILIGAAATGAFTPLWSARILEEWARATRRLPAGAEAIARAEIAILRADWPASEITAPPDLAESLSLPDPEDRHVLAAAIASQADTLITLNRRDFPTRTLARHGVLLRDPDGFLAELNAEGIGIAAVVASVQARAESISGRDQPIRPLLKRAGLPKLGKALTAGSNGFGQQASLEVR